MFWDQVNAVATYVLPLILTVLLVLIALEVVAWMGWGFKRWRKFFTRSRRSSG